MKITFRRWAWFHWQVIRVVHVQKRKDKCWTLNSQRKVLAALKETEGIDVEN